MECLEDVSQLRLSQPVKVCYNCVEFMNHTLLFIILELSTLTFYCLSPLCVAFVGGGESTCQQNRSLPEFALSPWPGNWKRVEDMKVEVNLHKSSRVPVKG